MAEREGQQFGNYRLVRLLGRGGFADVYLGNHIYLESQAAIKVLHNLTSDNAKDIFLLEARRLVRLNHPYVIRLLEFGIEGDAPFLVMEYAPNGSMRNKHPKGSQVSLETVVVYIKKIADTLQYLHEQKLIHRDVKPENLLSGSNNEILLSDLGIATVAHTTGSAVVQGQAGTAPYMAPEQILEMPRPASDQYSLGIIAYEWLSGTLPFQGTTMSILHQHIYTPLPALHERFPIISLAIESVILKALAKDPKDRFPTVYAFARALEHSYQSALPPLTVPLTKNAPMVQLSLPNEISLFESMSADLSVVQDRPYLLSPSNNQHETDNEAQVPKVDMTFHQWNQPVLPAIADSTLLPGQFSASSSIEVPANKQPHISIPLSPFAPPAYPLKNTFDPNPMRPQLMQQSDIAVSSRRPLREQHFPFLLQRYLHHKQFKPSILFIISAAICIILALISVMFYIGYQAITATAVTVNFGPMVKPLEELYAVTAVASTQSVDVKNCIIPVHVFIANQTLSQTGPTTGQVNCTQGTSGCQQGVAASDADSLVGQMRQELERQIAQQVKGQIASAGGIQVTNITYADVSAIPTPAIGQPATTVNVTMVEQGSVGYIVSADATSVARYALMNQVTQLGVNYTLLSNTILIGRPVIESINSATGQVALKIAASGVAIYQFPTVQLQSIRDSIKSKTTNDFPYTSFLVCLLAAVQYAIGLLFLPAFLERMVLTLVVQAG